MRSGPAAAGRRLVRSQTPGPAPRLRLYPARAHGAETRTLLGRLVEAARSDPTSWGLAWALQERERPAGTDRERWLWGPSADAAEALVWLHRFAGLGSAAGAFVVPGANSLRRLRALASDLDLRAAGGPLLRFSEWVPGTSGRTVREALRPLGFRWISRVDYQFPAARMVPTPPLPAGGRVRPVTLSDEGPLRSLIVEAYQDDPVERALFRERANPNEDARLALHRILHRGLGTWQPRASFVLVAGGRVRAATLVNDFHGPLLSQVMVHSEYRHRGWARYLLARTLAAVRELTTDPLRLVVTERNRRAVSLYRSFGFRVQPESRGAVGVRVRFR